MKRSGGEAGRPLGKATVPDLEKLVSKAGGQTDELQLVLAELGHRKTKRARELESLVKRLLGGEVGRPKTDNGPLFDR